MSRIGELPLGRLYSEDENDQRYRMESVVPMKFDREYRYWNATGIYIDQVGSTCVGASWTQWAEDGPVGQTVPIDYQTVYIEATKIDEWTDNDGVNGSGDVTFSFGSSVRAGAKVMQSLGICVSYWWGYTVEELAACILNVGPAVIGIPWSAGFDTPKSNGTVDLVHDWRGGHAIKVDGVNTKLRMFRLKNTWSRLWGRNGFCYVTFDQMSELMRMDSEICLATEQTAKVS